MIFIINKTIVFKVSEKTISNGLHSLQLSNPASRLLLVLLENKNQPVEREELLRRVWEDYGLTASGNSLTNNISILRRSLSELGAEKIIETIPRQGVMLKPDELEFNELVEDYVFAQQSMAQPILMESKKWRRLIIGLSSGLLLLFAGSIILIMLSKQSEWAAYKKIGKCQVLYREPSSVAKVRIFFDAPEGRAITRLCDESKIIFYDDVKVDPRNGITDVFLSVCTLNRKGELDECKNYVEVAIN